MLLRITCVGVAVAVSVAARAQPDVDIFVSVDNGVLTVDGNELTPGSGRAYVPRFNSFYSVNNPGFNAAPGTLPALGRLEWDFLPMTVGGVTSTLLYWDGEGESPDFGPTPNELYTLALFGIDEQQETVFAEAAGEDQLVVGEIFDFAFSSGGLHEHRSFFLDDDGNSNNFTNAAAGFYLIAMRLRAEGLERSDPFYLAWGTSDSSAATQTEVLLPWLQERVDTLVLPGDHNFDGAVDAADYTVWRDGSGSTHSAIDLTQWRENYGAMAATAPAVAVPEPGGLRILAMAAAMGCGAVRRYRTPNR